MFRVTVQIHSKIAIGLNNAAFFFHAIDLSWDFVWLVAMILWLMDICKCVIFFMSRYEIYYFTGDDMALYQTLIRWANIFSLSILLTLSIFIASP